MAKAAVARLNPQAKKERQAKAKAKATGKRQPKAKASKVQETDKAITQGKANAGEEDEVEFKASQTSSGSPSTSGSGSDSGEDSAASAACSGDVANSGTIDKPEEPRVDGECETSTGYNLCPVDDDLGEAATTAFDEAWLFAGCVQVFLQLNL